MAEHLTDKLIQDFPVADGEAIQTRDGRRCYEKLGPRIPKVFGTKEARKRAEELNADWS